MPPNSTTAYVSCGIGWALVVRCALAFRTGNTLSLWRLEAMRSKRACAGVYTSIRRILSVAHASHTHRSPEGSCDVSCERQRANERANEPSGDDGDAAHGCTLPHAANEMSPLRRRCCCCCCFVSCRAVRCAERVCAVLTAFNTQKHIHTRTRERLHT